MRGRYGKRAHDTLDEFIESVKESVFDEGSNGRTELAENGCDGQGEYSACAAISTDYERILHEHGVMLAIIEAAQHRGRYLEDAYQDSITRDEGQQQHVVDESWEIKS